MVSVNLVWNRFLGDVPCSQQLPVINLDESVVNSLVPLVDPVRGDVLWHEQHNTAAHFNYKMIDRKPSLRPEPRVHSSPKTRSDVLPARPTLRRTRDEVEVKRESNINLNFSNFSNQQVSHFYFQQNANYKVSTKRKFNKFRLLKSKFINMNVQKIIVLITKRSSLEERCDTPAKKTIKQMFPSDVFSKVVVRREKAALDDDIEH